MGRNTFHGVQCLNLEERGTQSNPSRRPLFKVVQVCILDIWVNGLKTTALHYNYKQTRKILFVVVKKVAFYGEWEKEVGEAREIIAIP